MLEQWEAGQEQGELSRSQRFRVTRLQLFDGSTWIAKAARSPGDREAEAALEHEHAILQRLDLPGISRVRGLERSSSGSLCLILHDAGPATLADRRGHALSTEEFFAVAEPLTNAVASVHGQHIAHLGLEPANVVVGHDGRLTLIDFETAAVTPVGQSVTPSPRVRNLHYLAPEQTGQVGTLADERSDLYSLGAILYELLTGYPPFRADDSLELIHAHMTRLPVSPSVVVPDVPGPLSQIVLTLLAKSATARYQSATALAADLAEARARWRDTGTIESFELGRFDRADQLRFPEELYGRDRELAQMREALDRVTGGARQLLWVAGDAGLGKSTLVNALRSEVELRGGHFLSGKFDLRKANLPFASLSEALHRLACDLLSGSDEQQRLRAAWAQEGAGPSGRVLVELVPRLAALLGDLPRLSSFDPETSRARLHIALGGFLAAIAQHEGPLVVFLDDLQWADAATIEALGVLATDPDLKRVLLIGAYRPGEIDCAHPLAQLVRTTEGNGAGRMELTPLSRAAVCQLVADALLSTVTEVRTLADVVMSRAGGNPLFVRGLLMSLQSKGILVYEASRHTWLWDAAQLETIELSEDVAELLTGAIGRLPADACALLPVAACVGRAVEVGLLARLLELAPDEVQVRMAPALRSGLVTASFTNDALLYQFAHDRIQQAAGLLLSERERWELHLRIGHELMAQNGGDSLFAAADQLNLGAGAVDDPSGHLEIAQLDLRAGLRARASAAFASALAYFRSGLASLMATPEPWRLQHQLSLALHKSAGECAYLSGDYAQSDALIDQAIEHALDPAEAADVHNVKVVSAGARAAWREALDRGWAALAALGRDIAPRSSQGAELRGAELSAWIAEEKTRLATLLDGRTPDALVGLANNSDPSQRAALRLLDNLRHPAWFQDRQLFQLLTLRALATIVANGHAPESVTAFSSHAIVLASSGDVAGAEAFSNASLALAEKPENRGQLAFSLLVDAGFVQPWRKPLAAVIPQLRRALELGRRYGEIRSVAYALSTLVIAGFSGGRQLDELLHDIDNDMTFLHKAQNQAIISFHMCYRQAIRCLQGATRGRTSFDDESFDEGSFLPQAAQMPPLACLYHVRRLHTSYLFGDLALAAHHAEAAEQLIEFLGGYIPAVEHNLYSSLTWVALCRAAPPDQLHRLRAAIGRNQSQLATWADANVAGFRHLHQLVDAELAALSLQHARAADLYQNALEGAARARVLHHEALACELAARHATRRGMKRVAAMYGSSARDLYARWGASEKVRAMEESDKMIAGAASGAAPADVNLIGLFRMAETLTTEVAIDRLLAQLVDVCAQVAGASRIAVVLEEEGVPFVRAVGDSGQPVDLMRAPLGETGELPIRLVEDVRSTRETLVIDDAPRDPRTSPDPYLAKAQARSMLVVPVLRHGDLIAVIYFENRLVPRSFPAARRRIIDLLSAQIAGALENGLLFARLKQEIAERTQAEESVRFLADAGAELVAIVDYAGTLDCITRLAVPELGDWCVVDLLDDQNRIRRAATAHSDPNKLQLLDQLAEPSPDWSSDQPTAIVLRSGAPLLIPELSAEDVASFLRNADNLRRVEAIGARSLLAVPMTAHGTTTGVLTLIRDGAGKPYTSADQLIAHELARRAGLAIEAARLFQRVQDAVRVREEFLSVAAHELNTPITSLKLVVDGLVGGAVAGAPATVRHVLEIANRQIDRLTRLVGELLDVSRIGAQGVRLTLEAVDVSEVAAEVAERMRAEAERAGSEIRLETSEAVVGQWDRSRLDQVVSNLLSNAIKFGAGSPIDVVVSANQRSAVLEVIDRGLGIAPEHQERIFRRFERGVSVQRYGGLGLGLYITRSLVEAMGGTIGVDSAAGAGSTFTVRLPRPTDGPV